MVRSQCRSNKKWNWIFLIYSVANLDITAPPPQQHDIGKTFLHSNSTHPNKNIKTSSFITCSLKLKTQDIHDGQRRSDTFMNYLCVVCNITGISRNSQDLSHSYWDTQIVKKKSTSNLAKKTWLTIPLAMLIMILKSIRWIETPHNFEANNAGFFGQKGNGKWLFPSQTVTLTLTHKKGYNMTLLPL